ncbi:hypothetical protein AB0H18_10625 [Streptomyces sp. NPDC020766]|uniref:hypothetical protein n=1 Tax=Streptomyces sp. NPDC020766 TaxID=3155011 RepID=UPI0033E83B41
MAKRIEMPAAQTRYPWREWADGSGWEAKQGADFQHSPEVFRKQVRTYARRHSLTVVTSVQGDSVFFQFSTPDADDEGE